MPKPSQKPTEPFPPQVGDWLWVPLRNEWVDVRTKPEEIVRQAHIHHLVQDLGYALEQMDQERRIMHGHHSPRADIVVWESATAKTVNKSPILVIECKAESVDIIPRDYYQGESYTRASGCEFFVAHNRRFTAVFRLIPGAPGEFVQINEIPKAADWGNAKKLEAIRKGLRAFNRREFQDLLFECHSILRDVHKMDPGRAFDTMSKILFVKMYIERTGNHGTFSTDFLDQRAATRLPTEPAVHDTLFNQTKSYYRADDLFSDADKLDISESTFRRIVKKLERFDLSKTGDDIKGLAFERFLGNTFRGELGQFFTPRPVVDFMVAALDPQEGELICDPAAGSGGFLIRAFEHVRAAIAEDIQAKKDKARVDIEALGLEAEEEERRIEAIFHNHNLELLPSDDLNQPLDTRVGRLAWRCIFGTDADARPARTAKMNMIMHGDGHGGIHHHDGLVDINGIFPDRFDVILTNPPFGSNVGEDQKLGASAETRVPDDADYIKRCEDKYGPGWRDHHTRLVQAAANHAPILELFEVGKGKANRATEIVFVERCLKLLKPGGRVGIVLPDGNLNNPSLAWLRRWCESKARIDAIVSLPEATFVSSKATVKASLVFLTAFTVDDVFRWEAAWIAAHKATNSKFDKERDTELATLNALKPKRKAAWSRGSEPSYPRGIGTTKLAKPLWDKSTVEAGEKAWTELRLAIKDIDRRHDAALWTRVRDTFDYPVFVASPKAVGITSTGETEGSANDLPEVLKAWRAFLAWRDTGADPQATPSFSLPFAA